MQLITRSIKTALKKITPPIFFDVIKYFVNITKTKSRGASISAPWSDSYESRKKAYVYKIISDDSIIDDFNRAKTLPQSFGIGIDERCIEYPWLFANLSHSEGLLLDAGSTLNHEHLINNPFLEKKNLHIMTLAPEANCFWKKGISYIYTDLCDIPIKNDFYDEIACISVLEHIGCDNSLFSNTPKHDQNRPFDFMIAVEEMKRVLKPGGSLLVTVPFGSYRHHGMFQQFDLDLLAKTIHAFGEAAEVTETFYRYSSNGWQLSSAVDCADCDYVEWVVDAWQNDIWPATVPVEPDYAAAARAVACLRFIKQS